MTYLILSLMLAPVVIMIIVDVCLYFNYKKQKHDNNEPQKSTSPQPLHNLKNASRSIVSDEIIFTKEEAMACFCAGATVIKRENLPMVPVGIFMLSTNEKYQIYKDLMMWAVYLLGIKSESKWTQIYADAENLDILNEAIKRISQFSNKKKTCVSVFLRTIAGSDADAENSEHRLLTYHAFCTECGLKKIYNGNISSRLSMKMTIYNRYDYMWKDFSAFIDKNEMADCVENDVEFD